jgi:hypothetical protein
MASTRGVRIGQRTTFKAGPWPRVVDTRDPYDDGDGSAQDAQNGYIPDPTGNSGFYSRPGFSLLFSGSPFVTQSTAFRGQGIYSHVALDTTTYNFTVVAGKLFRVDQTLSTKTDVTPAGVTIDATITTRVKFLTLADNLLMSDGVNPPVILTNLGSTPVTATKIDYDGSGTPWAAQDMTVYGGSVMFALNKVGTTARRSDLAWCEPGLPAVGYQQSGYSNFWTYQQSGSGAIFAVVGTNVACYIFRARSIGAISGAIGPDLSSQATHDEISRNVGTESPQSVQLFGDTFYFCDQIGRPYAFTVGSVPDDTLWKNMRQVVDTSTTAYPGVTKVTATSAFEPTLNLFIVAIWSPVPSQQASPTKAFVYDAATMRYMGRWTIGGSTGVSIDCLGTFTDSTGRSVLIAIGSASVGGATGYAWSFNSLLGQPDDLTTEDGVFLTTEDGVQLTTEGQPEIWMDNGEVPPISVTTDRLGYSEDLVYNVDQATVITTNDSPVRVTITTSSGASVIEGTPVPASSADGTFRSVVGCDAFGRGMQVTVGPTTADEQWSLQRISLVAVASLAGPEDA